MKFIAYALSASIGFISLPVVAAEITQVNRYATVAHKPLSAQVSPLSVVQQVHFPLDIKNIGQALDYWLHYSGFHLARPEKQTTELKQLLTQPLPQVDRTLGPLSIRDGLTVLVGQAIFTLTEDPLLREVNFKRKGNTV